MNLENLRIKIDAVDQAILSSLAQRNKLVAQIAKYKEKHNLPVFQKDREETLLKKRVTKGKTYGLHETFVLDIFKRIIKESHEIQNNRCKKPGTQ